ncbi:MAG TPA: TonB-dependent receptor plug domain-containing protein, partial [Candidatus Kapabacteria bacterium]|nr:TonB-dependent receptor plug domain-containing protein [Candidatus Kapabacteria bacterium]
MIRVVYRIPFFLTIAFLFCSSSLFAQQTTGTLEITTSLEGVTDYHGYILRLFESSTHRRFSDYEVSATGTTTIHDLPFGNYSIWLMTSGDAITLQQQVAVHSTVPIKLMLSKGQGINPVIVEAQLPDISRPVVKTVFPASEIAILPSPSSAMKMEAVLLNTPGVVPDEDGRLHMRGEDAQIQYVVDGIPIFTNQTEVYSSLFNAGLIKSADIIRGGFNAEYGIALSGVVNVHTRSGFDHPLFADATASYGSFGTKDRTLSLGGNIDNSAALFFSYGSSETERYLDPIRSFQPNHTDGYTHNYFAKADFLLSDDIDLVLIGTTNL